MTHSARMPTEALRGCSSGATPASACAAVIATPVWRILSTPTHWIRNGAIHRPPGGTAPRLCEEAMPLTELNHYFVRTSDLQASRDFYCDALGFEEMPRPNFEFPGYWLGVNGK